MSVNRRTVAQEAERNAPRASGAQEIDLAESIAGGVANFMNPKIPFIAPDGLFTAEDETARKQAILAMMPTGAMNGVSDTVNGWISAGLGAMDGWLETAAIFVEAFIPNNTVSQRNAFASKIESAAYETALAPLETTLDTTLTGVTTTLANTDLLTAGRAAAAASMRTSMLGTSLFSDEADERMTALQRSHAAASVAMRNILLANRDPSTPEAAFGEQATLLADKLATAMTGVPSPTTDGAYLEVGDTFKSLLRGPAAAFVTTGTLPANAGYDAAQLAEATSTIGAFNTALGASSVAHRARLARLDTEIAAINLTGIADTATQAAFRANLKALRLDNRVDDNEFRKINEAIGSDASGIQQFAHGIASITDAEQVEGVTVPDGSGLAVIDMNDDSSFTPSHGVATGDAAHKQTGYNISAALGS